MAYRRPDDEGVFSSRWLRAHRDKLTECGVPRDFTALERRWIYVLSHGDDLETGWDTSWLTDQQAAMLLGFLDPFAPNSVGLDLLEALRRRCRR